MRAVVSRRRRASAKPPAVGPSLARDPSCGVVVPLVSCVGDRADGCGDQVPAILAVQSPRDRASDESAATPLAGNGIDALNELVIQLYVHSHV